MRKITVSILTAAIAISLAAGFVNAATSTDEAVLKSLLTTIETLRAQIASLQAKIAELILQKQELKAEVKETKTELKDVLKISKNLSRGMSGEDVRLLQEVLATDPDVYPEGLVTGYFGPLTEKAVKKFQEKMGVEQVGLVGPKTTSKINELLTEGAGSSGKVPPGLLIAPGIAKKIGYTPAPLAGQVLPPGIAKKVGTTTPEEPEDETAPIISSVSAAEITQTTAKIIWTTDEPADSLVYYGTSSGVAAVSSTSHVSSATASTSHSILLQGLTASTTYYYIVFSADSAANSASSSEKSFATLALDATAPIISSVSAGSIASTSASIVWTTDEQADSKMYYSTSTPVDTSAGPQVSNSALVLSHSLGTSGLNASTTYYYLVVSADSAGNSATSSEQSFATLSQ